MPGSPGKPTAKSEPGRSDFLNATKNAAGLERIRKEERALHRLFEQQIALGRIELPPEEEEPAGGAAGSTGSAPPSPEAVAAQTEWLLAARRGAGGAAGQASAAEQGAPACQAGGEEDDGAQLRRKLDSISASLWGTVAAGAASGRGTYATRSRSDYAYKPEAVAAMQERGELDPTHRRRRDEHTAFLEAAARDRLLRRGGHTKPAEG